MTTTDTKPTCSWVPESKVAEMAAKWLELLEAREKEEPDATQTMPPLPPPLVRVGRRD